MIAPGFLLRDVPALGKKDLFRLGLSGSFGLDEASVAEALERIQYVFFTQGPACCGRCGKRSPATGSATW